MSKEQQEEIVGPEPIAVIGMGCRFSGEASSLEGFWNMIREGRTGHCKVPPNRYEASGWHHPSHDRKGSINHDSGFFLEEDPSRFDAPFFSITAKEAAGMDPVQRLLLEVAYEAFENGGVPMESLPGSRTAVFSGCMTNDYELLSTCDMHDMPHNSATGNGRTMLANRLSWFYDLRGPSVMLDTACSSSLTALHLATQALRANECDTALITGASLILHPNFTQRLSYMHMLSADGISHSFDKKANGYGRGEGFGALLLKPLSKALKDKDAIRAVIRATGVNQDGRTPGITMPSRTSQADLIRTVYGPGLPTMRDTAYFEAHGTGTEIGDPTELSAIGETFGAARSADDPPLYVGSVKSNMGHTEGAAGVASLIKVVLCLEKGVLVPNAGFSEVNPKILLDDWKLRLSNEYIPWPSHLPQRASINSFGFGGSNAHALIESASEYLGSVEEPLSESAGKVPQVVVFSTYDKAGINRMATKWTSFLQTRLDAGQDESLQSIAHTMGIRRSKLPFRSFAVADSQSQLCEVLRKGLPEFPPSESEHEFQPVFAESMARSQEILSNIGCTWDLIEEIKADAASSRMSQPDRSQSICCALQIALVDLLASWQVHPRAVIGHSSGEIGAAYAAGFLTHQDAIRVAYFRGVLSLRIAQNGRRGGMLAAGISPTDAEKYLADVPSGSVVIACVNSPASITLSGDVDQIDLLEKKIQDDKCFARKLRVETAYHSPHMYDLADDYEAALKDIEPKEGRQGTVAMFSSVTKEPVHAKDLGAAYWVRNMVSTVEFASAVSQLATMTESRKGRRRAAAVKWSGFLELGPHEALKGPFTQTLQSIDGTLITLPYQALVKRNTNALQTGLQVAGLLWSIGTAIDIASVNLSVNATDPKIVHNLPSYPWNHQSSFWHEPLVSTRLRQRKEPRHDLLGIPWDYQNDLEPQWRNFLRVSEMPWLADHVVAGSIILPAAGMVSMVAEAARQLAETSRSLQAIEFNDLGFLQGVVVPDDDRGLETVLHVAPHPTVPGWFAFGIFSLPKDAAWIKHATGAFNLHYDDSGKPIGPQDWSRIIEEGRDRQAAAPCTKADDVYEWLSNTGGVTLGPTFRSISNISFCESGCQLWIDGIVPDTQRTAPYERESAYFMHPTSLDALLQAAVLSCSDGLSNQNANIPIGVDRLYLPTSLDLRSGDRFTIHTTTRSQEGGSSRSDSIASDPSWGHPSVVLQGIQLGRVPMAKKAAAGTGETSMSRYSSISWAAHPILSGGAGASQTQPGQLSDWVQGVCHVYGDARALLITPSSESSEVMKSLHSFLPGVGQRPSLQELMVIIVVPDAPTESQIIELREFLPGAQVQHIETMQDLTPAALDDKQFDVVFVDHPSIWNSSDMEASLSSISLVAQPDGCMALRTSSIDKDASKNIKNTLGWRFTGETQDGDFVLASRDMGPVSLDSTIFLLTTDSTPLQENLKSSLEQTFATLDVEIRHVELQEIGNLAGKMVISLLEFERPWVSSWTASSMSQFQALLNATYILWVSPCSTPMMDASAAGFGATTGLLRTLRNEKRGTLLPQLQFNQIDAVRDNFLAKGILQVMEMTLAPLTRSSHDLEYRLQDGRIMVPRVVAADQVDRAINTLLHGPRPAMSCLVDDTRPLQFKMDPQDTKHAYWAEDSALAAALPEDHVEVQLKIQTISPAGSSVNSSPEALLRAVEAVGTIRELGSMVKGNLLVGDTVVLLSLSAESGLSLSNRLRVPASAVMRLPVGITPEQAVSVPLAYTLAYISLFDTTRLGPNDSILVVGSISQTLRAILNCALMIPGVQIFVATTSTAERDELASQYHIPPNHIMSIHGGLDTKVMRMTNDKGITAVVSCVSGGPARLAASTLAYGGHFLDISGQMKAAPLPNSFIEKSCTFSVLNLNVILQKQPEKAYDYFRQASTALCSHRYLQAGAVFSVADWSDAKDHALKTGSRVAINLDGPGEVLIEPLQAAPVPLPREHTFILAGGLGTLGLALATTLVENGAGHLVFLSRSGTVQDALKPAINELSSKGCCVDIVPCDISIEGDIQQLLSEAREHQWHIKGVLQCATVLQDSMFEKMSFEEWKNSTQPKILGTFNLHHLLLNEGLDFFVTLSSVASVIGNMGQSNYSAGNSYMDDLMSWRQAHGLPGNSINIGLVPDASGVGDVSESPEERRRRYSHLEGTEILTDELQALLQLILQRQVSIPAQVLAGMTDTLPRDGGASWLYDRKFDHRVRLLPSETDEGVLRTSGLLKRSASIDEATQIVIQGMQEYLANAMTASADSIDTELALPALGVDSLKATEVQNWVSREMGAELSSFEFLGSQSVRALSEKIAQQSSFVTVP
ncbi:Acyl transferase/acyl hydrolase/lysophospholipase [Penicillium malachiteum]|uniref:Acyl transferase/acyl hydrolase/lysophospholipase n=1 Tax=Penicillium malachiteum TaxID=1324776 RepID=UPI002546F7E8|nr:Acyl transferase/acyl hydrolase/lysophospholipase [Penicillium malachiteum]KAJ5737446.1 Acyl transferase/acyl hydrolase/lysophospholipase [Penicillium malachiteum]